MKRIWPWIHTYSSFRHTAKCPCELDNKQELNDTRLHNSPNFMGSDFFLWNKFKESTCWILICVRPPFAWFVGWINRCGATYLKSCWVLFIFVAIFASNTLLWIFHSLREFAYLFFLTHLNAVRRNDLSIDQSILNIHIIMFGCSTKSNFHESFSYFEFDENVLVSKWWSDGGVDGPNQA